MIPKAKQNSKEIDKKIGEKLLEFRNFCELTQEDVGKHLGVSFQQIQKYEKASNRISAASLKRVADLFEVPVSAFYEQELHSYDKHTLQMLTDVKKIKSDEGKLFMKYSLRFVLKQEQEN